MAGRKGWIVQPHQTEFRQWCARRCPRLWLLAGEDGLGKSELLQRFFEQCRADSIAVLRFDHASLMAAERDAEALLRRVDCSSAHGFVTARKPAPGAPLPGWAGLLAGTAPPVPPELAMLRGFNRDAAGGGAVLVDDWDRLEGEAVNSRLVFRRGFPPVATAGPALQPFADWLRGLADWLLDHPVAVIGAGRRRPALGGTPRLDAATVAFPPLTPFGAEDLGRCLGETVDGLPAAPAEALERVAAVTGGMPLMVTLFGRYLKTVLVPGMAAGLWEIIDEVTAGYLADPEFGAVARVGARAGAQAGRQDLRFWRLAIPRLVERDLADALFPLAEGPPGGGALFDHYVALGLIQRPPARPEWVCLHASVRAALERFARRSGLWRSRQFDEVNRRLAQVYRQRGADLDAARHTVLGFTGFEQRFGVDREAFWDDLARSALTAAEKAGVVAGLPGKGPDDVRTLRSFLAESAVATRRPADGGTASFIEMATRRPLSADEVAEAGLDLDAIVDANPTDWPVLRLVTGLRGLDPSRRAAILDGAFAAGCRDLDFLRSWNPAGRDGPADDGRLAAAFAAWQCRR